MSPDSACETCFTCNKKPINFHKISDPDGNSMLNTHEIICKHFWFKEDDLRSAIVCESCWEKVDQFHQFYQDVEKLHEHRQMAVLSMFIKQEEITIEETRLQENCIDISTENQKSFDIADCKHEMPEVCDELSKKEKPTEVSRLRRKAKYTKRLPNKRVVKRKNPHSLLTTEERQAEDDLIKQHTRYICDECNIEYENFKAIQYHRLKAHNKYNFVCCGNQYRLRSILYQHVQNFLNPEGFKCEICGKSFKYKKNYDCHKEWFHATKGNEMAKCEFCCKLFPHKYLLNKHVKDVHKKPMNFICEVCSKGFHRRGMFLAHHKMHELTAEQLKEQCKCEVCGHVSSNMMSLKRHMQSKHALERKTHACEVCDKEYSRTTYLKEHIAKAHTREHLYHCEHCEMKFFSSSIMHKHRKKDHSQEWLLSKNARN